MHRNQSHQGTLLCLSLFEQKAPKRALAQGLNPVHWQNCGRQGFIPNKNYCKSCGVTSENGADSDRGTGAGADSMRGTRDKITDVNSEEDIESSNNNSLDEITILEYSQYAMVYKLAQDILIKLEQHFHADTASQIFSYAVIMCVNGFINMDTIKSLYEQSWLSLINKKFGFDMGKTALENLLYTLAVRGNRVHNYEQAVIDDCANGKAKIAICCHALRSYSDDNDLAESVYKHSQLNADQVNLLMGYDAERGFPLFARFFRGTAEDQSTVVDTTNLYRFKNILFIVDREFYSEDNLQLFSKNEKSFIIPLPANTEIFNDAMSSIEYTGDFYYRAGKKHTRVEYMERVLANGRRIVVYRDIDENEKTRYDYLRSIDQGKAEYTQENYEKNKDFFGVHVLLTNATLEPQDIFENYKQRLPIETFYYFLKNSSNFNNLEIDDYYKKLGFSFIMLITGQIQHYLEKAVKKLNDNTTSVFDALTMARFMKIHLNKGSWHVCNLRTKDLTRMKKIGFEPDKKIIF